MMKLLVSFVLIAVAVRADYTYVQPELPCAYQVSIKVSQAGTITSYLYRANGRYTFAQTSIPESGVMTVVSRPDINTTINGTEKSYSFLSLVSVCVKTPDDFDFRHTSQKAAIESYAEGYSNRAYKHKETKTINEKLCDCYYDDDADTEAIYVYDDFIYLIHSPEGEALLEYTWEAPMRYFALDEAEFPNCKKQDERIYSIPSAIFSHCSDDSSDDSSHGTVYKYVQPKLPCAFELELSVVMLGSLFGKQEYKVNGGYELRKTKLNGNETTKITRPDIKEKINGTEMIAEFEIREDFCRYEFVEKVEDRVQQEIESAIESYSHRDYRHKEVMKVNGRNCDCYYDVKEEIVCVYEDFIYMINNTGNRFAFIFDYTWKEPKMKEFKIDKDDNPSCLEGEERIYDTPSEKYSSCYKPPADPSSSTTRTQAVMSVIVAVLAASLI